MGCRQDGGGILPLRRRRLRGKAHGFGAGRGGRKIKVCFCRVKRPLFLLTKQGAFHIMKAMKIAIVAGGEPMEDKRCFLFLDVDGVLNTSAQWGRRFYIDSGCFSRFAHYAVNLSAGKTKIILSSTWKNGFDPAGNHAPHIFDLLKRLQPFGLSILGKTETDEATWDRAKEIRDFIVSHGLQKSRCIVIDDDRALFKTRLPLNCEMIFTDARKGFALPKRRSCWHEFLKIGKQDNHGVQSQ